MMARSPLFPSRCLSLERVGVSGRSRAEPSRASRLRPSGFLDDPGTSPPNTLLADRPCWAVREFAPGGQSPRELLMASYSRTASIRSHLLAVACAILGLMLDAMPTSSPWLVGPDCPWSGGDSPASPRPEDTEGDEAPVEASDLAWPIQVVLVRSTGR